MNNAQIGNFVAGFGTNSSNINGGKSIQNNLDSSFQDITGKNRKMSAKMAQNKQFT